MITNKKITIYHKGKRDVATRIEKYVRFNYDNVWCFEKERAVINQGYDDNNQINIRIPYKQNENLDVSNFAKGDIIVIGKVKEDIEAQSDLKGYKIYNIDSITDNNFGNEPHIHIGGV